MQETDLRELLARAEHYLRDYAKLFDNLDAVKLLREIDGALCSPSRK
jgi:hypothetical protein